MLPRVFAIAMTAGCILLAGPSGAGAEDYRAGVARAVITPEAGLWMAGYAARTKPAEGKVQDLFAKALALEDGKGQKLVLVTTDLLGFPRELSAPVAEAVARKYGLRREQLLLTSSHTHCGPVLRPSLIDMYDLSPDQKTKLEAYAEDLKIKLVRVVGEALADLKPARLGFGKGTARFAINRRQGKQQGVVIGTNPEGPVDHEVPVLRVVSPDDKLRALVFGYACHNTTLSFLQWCGDYAGYAQEFLEDKHPGVMAMFWSGCGGDANPQPRGELDHAKKHGRELADAVESVLAAELTPITGAFHARYTILPLPLGTLPTREKLTADTLSKNKAEKGRAERLLKILDKEGKLDDHYRHYPIQAWRLGDQLLWLSLGGEVVVDYAHRLKKELGKERTVWVTAYANDVMAYIPSKRVLLEGGYEADSSMIYYGLPTKWAPEVEEIIVNEVHSIIKN
jgi:neutral ceramidase